MTMQQPTVDKSDDRLVIRIFQKNVSLLICITWKERMVKSAICLYTCIIYISMFAGVEFPFFSLSIPANIEELIVFTAVCNEVILFHNININKATWGDVSCFFFFSISFFRFHH